MTRVPARGLADLAGASTALSDVDGLAGRHRLSRPDSQDASGRGLRWVPLGAQ